ncbi:hypothetical protein F9278_30395 [Streptomyces phaeolivaceus]|uniref:Uncharacterized protein n=1 Tax=Streptomyces phaeolivaceus TaxID=2653200 RepID=A0A5P8K9G7_9ACTN|nr:hypothetical protein [Streptomyces phaeolivaceus]QFQ99751.1 hypothetical protein F9278_30395 [Streptomyces phaeolivaceus]
MSEILTLDGLAAPLRALRLLVTDFGHLPVPDVQVSPIYPDRLELRFHNDLNDFEAWREAVGIAPDAVEYREQNGARTRVLTVSGDYAGAVVVLTGYGDVTAPVPAPVPAGGAA